MRAVTGSQYRGQRGLSLVELMVGIAVGLFIVAASTMLVSTQLAENRRLLTETQIQQDLRATTDIITRELRRAGSSGSLADSVGTIWTPSGSAAVNPYLALTIVPGTSGSILFKSSRTENPSRGFRLIGGAIESRLDGTADTWQKLTDDSTMTVDEFSIAEQDDGTLQLPCPKMCNTVPPSTTCWPTVRLRSLIVTIKGHSTNDSSVVRSLTSTVRLRNDDVMFNDPLPTPQACPA